MSKTQLYDVIWSENITDWFQNGGILDSQSCSCVYFFQKLSKTIPVGQMWQKSIKEHQLSDIKMES